MDVGELHDDTRGVLGRVRRGETVDITDAGRLIARIVPVADLEPASVLDRLIADGRARPATRPGRLPLLHPGDGTDRLAAALGESRAAGPTDEVTANSPQAEVARLAAPASRDREID